MFQIIIKSFVRPGLLVLGVVAPLALGLATGPALAQSSEQIEALKDEIAALKRGQAAIQRSLRAVLEILKPLRSRTQTQAQKFKPKGLDLAGAARRGAEDAPVTLVEFTDYQCPFCRRHFQTTMPRILEDYVETGKLRYVLKEFPIPQLHPGAPKAAEGAICAGDQGRAWEMHDLIFRDPKAVSPGQLKDKAGELGLDVAAFSDCLDSGKYQEQVKADARAGRELGVSGTPSFALGLTDPEDPDRITATKLIEGARSYSIFKQAIDELIAKAKKGT